MITPLLIGLAHSVETDHIVAVSNLVEMKGNWLEEASRGAHWGLGHTVSVICVAGCLGYLKLVFGSPETWQFEILVGIMLIFIGAMKLYKYLSNEAKDSKANKEAFFNTGLIHGLAGSGSIAILLTTQASGISNQFTFLGLFGIGTILGMALITGLLTQFRILNTHYLSIISCMVAILSLAYGSKILINQFS